EARWAGVAARRARVVDEAGLLLAFRGVVAERVVRAPDAVRDFVLPDPTVAVQAVGDVSRAGDGTPVAFQGAARPADPGPHAPGARPAARAGSAAVESVAVLDDVGDGIPVEVRVVALDAVAHRLQDREGVPCAVGDVRSAH